MHVHTHTLTLTLTHMHMHMMHKFRFVVKWNKNLYWAHNTKLPQFYRWILHFETKWLKTCVKKEMSVRTLAVLWLDLEGWFPSTCILVFCLQVFATTDRSKKDKVRITSYITTVLQCLEILTESISLKVWIQLYMKQNANIQQKQNKIIEEKKCHPSLTPLPTKLVTKKLSVYVVIFMYNWHKV